MPQEVQFGQVVHRVRPPAAVSHADTDNTPRFNVATNIDGATVRCTLYGTMGTPTTAKYGTASFRKVAREPRFLCSADIQTIR